MKRLLAAFLFFLVAAPALAADNTLLVTPCASGCVTTKSKDVGSGVEAPQPIISDTSGNPLATAPGTGNTSFALPVQGVASGVALPISAASLPLPTSAATSANQTTANSSLATIATNTGAAIPAGSNLIGNTGQLYPAGSTPITASATGTTTATTATLAANASLHTYICGFSIRANATGAATNNATVTGTITGTLNFTQWTAPLASGLGVTEEVFSPCIISSAINTGVAVVSGAPGSGGVVSVTAWGYQL